MRVLLPSFIFIVYSWGAVVAQDTITIYYNKDWKEIQDKNQASYYRKAFLSNNKVWTAHDYFISNKIQMMGTFKSKALTVKHGHFIYFYENGKKEVEGEYVNNKHEGVWTRWYENGQQASVETFKKDLKQGECIGWHENGLVKAKGSYVDDNGEGKWEYWFESGEKRSEGTFAHNKEEGRWTYFHKTGQIAAVEEYIKGKLHSVISYFENGNIDFKGSYINGKRDGEWTYWNVDGRLILKGNFSNDLYVGEWTRFFPSGESMKMYYEKGRLVSKQLGGID